MNHMTSQHRDFEAIYAREKTEATGKVGGMLKYLKKQASVKAENIWAWIDWIVEDNLPFEFVASEKTRGYSKLEAISVNSLKKYIKLCCSKSNGKSRNNSRLLG